MRDNIIGFREFLNEESKLTLKELKYAVELAESKHYSVSRIRSFSGTVKKLVIYGKFQFGEKWIELMLMELNKTLETNYVTEEYIPILGNGNSMLTIVNK